MTCHIHSSGWSTCPLPLASVSRSNPYHIAHIGCSTSKGPLPSSCSHGAHSPCHPPVHFHSILDGYPPTCHGRALFQGPKNPFARPKEPFCRAQRTHKASDQAEQTKGYRSNPVHRTLLKTHKAELNIGLSAHVPRQHTVEAFSHACINYIYRSVGFNPNFGKIDKLFVLKK